MPTHTSSRGSNPTEITVAVSLASLAAGQVGESGRSPSRKNPNLQRAAESDEGTAHPTGPGGANRRAPAHPVTKESLSEFFTLPLHQVSSKLGMCTTAFKKLCRRLGIQRWPHRQLRGIEKRMASLRAELAYSSTADKSQFEHALHALQEEKSKLASGLASEGAPDHGACQDDDMFEDDAPSPPDSSARGDTAPAHDSEEESVEDDEGSGDRSGDGEGSFGSGNGVGMVSEAELRANFHLPLHTAARKFGICTTAFKKMCRRFGIAKWPHRQLRGLDKRIAALKAELQYSNGGDRQGCRKSLESLLEEKRRLSSPGATMGTPKRRSLPASVKRWPVNNKGSSEEHSDIDTDEEPMRADEEEEEELGAALPTMSSALDLLAAVAGVHDRVVEEKGRGLAGLATSVASVAAANAQADADPFDTPPMEPVDSTPQLQHAKVRIQVSPMLCSLPNVSQEHRGMTPMGAATPLIGLSWTGEPHQSALDQCA
mmetsp:Transcript_190/g.520  ORF Transcript_190/g.520 Transcript_190/m.520 type:complete len:486 (-) Transcript_190:232-1689(-)